MNLYLFTEKLIKIAEEKKEVKNEVSYGERALRAVPYLVGMGTGSVASMVLKIN